jgi:hypothetical protein
MNDPRERQAWLNASSHDQWDGFAGHRRAVCRLLTDPDTLAVDGWLCVLGAGNCHDLDLQALLGAYREVHLVDLDPRALERGTARQGVGGAPRLRVFGGVDLTGMLDELATWSSGTSMGAETLSALAEAPARRVPAALGGPYQVVASTCLLRPVIGAVYHAVGASHPRFAELVRAIRAGHLGLLAELVAPGGTVLVITDVVSSETLRDLPSMPESALAPLLRRIDAEQNHFHGVGPADLAAAFARSLPPGALAESLSPWRWNLHGRVYLVWALRSRKPPATLTTGGP